MPENEQMAIQEEEHAELMLQELGRGRQGRLEWDLSRRVLQE